MRVRSSGEDLCKEEEESRKSKNSSRTRKSRSRSHSAKTEGSRANQTSHPKATLPNTHLHIDCEQCDCLKEIHSALRTMSDPKTASKQTSLFMTSSSPLPSPMAVGNNVELTYDRPVKNGKQLPSRKQHKSWDASMLTDDCKCRCHNHLDDPVSDLRNAPGSHSRGKE